MTDPDDDEPTGRKHKPVILTQPRAAVLAALIALLGAALFTGGTTIYNQITGPSDAAPTTSTLPNSSSDSATSSADVTIPKHLVALSQSFTDEKFRCNGGDGHTFQDAVIGPNDIACGGCTSCTGGGPRQMQFRLSLSAKYTAIKFSPGPCEQATTLDGFTVDVTPSNAASTAIATSPAKPALDQTVSVSGAQFVEFSATVPDGSCFVLRDPEGVPV